MTNRPRATYRRACLALKRACDLLDLPCMYDSDGNYLPPNERPAGAHAVDYVAHYGGAYLYRNDTAGEATGAHFEPHDVFRANGFAAGGLGIHRTPLRAFIDALDTMAFNAGAAREEATPDDIAAMLGGDR